MALRTSEVGRVAKVLLQIELAGCLVTAGFAQLPLPVISSLTPSPVSAGGPNSVLTVNGEKFVPSATIQWNGTPLPTTFASSTRLSAPVAAALTATSGMAQIAVNSPNGAQSNPLTFAIPGSVLLQDDFTAQGTHLDYSRWTTVVGAPSFLGRTQLADWLLGAGGQFVVGANGAELALSTYNPTGFSLYGTQAESLGSFQPTVNSAIEFDTQLQLTSLQPGLVYGMYFYGCPGPCATQHDEIDIELVTNVLSGQSPLQVQLNWYADEPLGAGHGGLVNLPNGFDPLAAHTWTILWSLARIDFLVDGVPLGSTTTNVAQGPMQVNEIAWGPAADWAAAYSAALQPVSSAAANQTFTGLLTKVTVSSSIAPVAAFLDEYGAPALSFNGSTTFPDAGGLLIGPPGVAQAPNGDTFVVGLDSAGGVHLNSYSYASSTWNGWQYSGGILDTTSGLTAAVDPNGVFWFTGRDLGNRFWINSWNGTSFGGWILVANGVFANTSVPQIAITSDGTVWIIGTDVGGRVWSNSYGPTNQSFTGWVDRQAVMIGQPSATAGQDGMVYVAVRSVSTNSPVYITQIPAQNAATANTWLNGGGLVDTDPQITSQGGTVYLLAEAGGNTVYLLTFAESTQTFGSWTFTNGILNDATIAAQGGDVFIAGRDSSDRIYWYSATGNSWFFAGGAGISSTVLDGGK